MTGAAQTGPISFVRTDGAGDLAALITSVASVATAGLLISRTMSNRSTMMLGKRSRGLRSRLQWGAKGGQAMSVDIAVVAHVLRCPREISEIST